MKRKLLKQPRSAVWWTVAALLAGSGSLSAAHAQTSATASANTEVAWRGRADGGWMMGARALNAVGATSDQKAHIGVILQQASTDLKAQRAEGRQLRAQLTGLMTAATVDANAVEGLRQQMLVVQNTVSQQRVRAQLDALAVLSPTQRAQLGTQLAQRLNLLQRQRQERESLGGVRS